METLPDQIADNKHAHLFKAGNQLWRMREKSGRDKIFKVEQRDEFIRSVHDYMQYCKDNPLMVTDFIKSGPESGKIVYIPKERTPTIKGFCVRIGIDYQTYLNYEKDERYKDFFDWFSYARTIIESELQDAALAGTVNPMIASKILQLKDNIDITGQIDNTVTQITFIQKSIEDVNCIEVESLMVDAK